MSTHAIPTASDVVGMDLYVRDASDRACVFRIDELEEAANAGMPGLPILGLGGGEDGATTTAVENPMGRAVAEDDDDDDKE